MQSHPQPIPNSFNYNDFNHRSTAIAQFDNHWGDESGGDPVVDTAGESNDNYLINSISNEYGELSSKCENHLLIEPVIQYKGKS